MTWQEVQTMRNAAFLFAQSVAAMIELEGMKAENQWRTNRGESLAYTEEDFVKLQERYPLGHNSALSTLNINL